MLLSGTVGTHLHLWQVGEDARPRRCCSSHAGAAVGHGQPRRAPAEGTLRCQPLARRDGEGGLLQLRSRLLVLLYAASCSRHGSSCGASGCAGPCQGLLLWASRLQLCRGAAKGCQVEGAWQVKWACAWHQVELIAAASAPCTSGTSARRQGRLRSAEW